MKWIAFTAACLALIVSGCLDIKDASVFNTSQIEAYSVVFEKSLTWWNDNKGTNLSIGVDGASSAKFDTIDGSVAGTTLCSNSGCEIVFNSNLIWHDAMFCTVATHEIGHVVGLEENNPDWPIMNRETMNCPDESIYK